MTSPILSPKPEPIEQSENDTHNLLPGYSDDRTCQESRSVGKRRQRYSLGLSECIETKTTTVTTRTTREFPNIFSDDSRPLHQLDAKEYPLAAKPTPEELTNINHHLLADDDRKNGQRSRWTSSQQRQLNTRALKSAFQEADITSAEFAAPSKQEPPSPTEDYPRRLRVSRQRGTTPTPTPKSIPSPNHSQRPSRSSLGVPDRLRRPAFPEARRGGAFSRIAAGSLATPDTSELAEPSFPDRPSSSGRKPSLHASNIDDGGSLEPNSTSHTAGLYRAGSPAGSDSHTIYSSNVATPPITDADRPFGEADPTSAAVSRPSIDVAAAQDASLPSPRLSPTLAAAQLPSTYDSEREEDDVPNSRQSRQPGDWVDDSSFSFEPEWQPDLPLSLRGQDINMADADLQEQPPLSWDTEGVLRFFEAMRPEVKTYMLYQFLRRCPRPTLRVVANAVNPALKCDFLHQLPLELGYQVLSYLDCRDLCRAAQVSKHWRTMIDRNETGWKELFDKEGFKMAPGELEKAIKQGWGWQDPYGSYGYERDLSALSRLSSSEHDLTREVPTSPTAPVERTRMKRKRSAMIMSERKRRVRLQEAAAAAREDRRKAAIKQHKSEGPLSAANAAIIAVPDPGLSLPSLSQLHLFKSLYRRHHMIRRNWTSGEVKPRHVAFAAHPRHVITCLQFDEDKIITGSDDTLIHIYDTKTGQLRKKLEGHEGGVWALQYEGNVLVSGSTDRAVRVWNIEKGLCQQVFYGHTSTVRCLQILMPTEIKDESGRMVTKPAKPLIITGSRDSQLRVWRLPEAGSRRYMQSGPPAQESDCPYFIRTLAGHGHSVRAISAHGDTLVSGSYDSTVRVWRISTGETVHILQGHTQKVYSVVLDHARNRCISGSMDSLVKIWDLATGACLYTLEGHSLLVGLLDLRDDRLVSAAADSTLRIWDPENGKCRNTLMAHTGAITCFQHDARKVISGSEKMVKMWDTKTGECINDLLTDLSGMWQVKFDERRCIAAVQRDSLTYVEILDFGAVRDGEPPENLGKRTLLNEPEVRRIIEEEA